MAKVIIVGAGILGTMHAWQALARGHEVIHIERDATPSSASVRNFGLIWISGRASGNELKVSLRARELWDKLAQDAPLLQLRANGSLTVAMNDLELSAMQACLAKSDSTDRGWQLLSPEETRVVNPAVKGNIKGALYCGLDATVEPRSVLGQIRALLGDNVGYEQHFGIEVKELIERGDSVSAVLSDGRKIEADLAIVCAGADHRTLFANELSSAPLRRVRLQMMSTAPLHEHLTTSIADADSMRYYPAYDLEEVANFASQHPVAAEHSMQLLLVQRSDGTLTIGDTHEYDEPFEFKIKEEPYEYLSNVASEILGIRIPEITHRWDGVYSQRTDGAICDRQFISSNIVSVTGPGGRGNTLSPAIAEQTFEEMAL